MKNQKELDKFIFLYMNKRKFLNSAKGIQTDVHIMKICC